MSLFAFNEKSDHTPKIEILLLEHGADLNKADDDGRTPLFMLYFKHAKPVAEQLDPAELTVLLI